MAEYRRFVAYIYEYVNGRKNRNAGFAKVESRNHICRIQIHIQNLTLGEGTIEIFGFVRESGGLPTVRLGEGQVQNGSLDCRITTPEETVGGSAYGFCQMKGIWLRSGSGRNWATVFDDEPLDMEKLGRIEKAPADRGQEEAARERTEISEISEIPKISEIPEMERIEEKQAERESIEEEQAKPEAIEEKQAEPEAIEEEQVKPEAIEEKQAEPEAIEEEQAEPEAAVIGEKQEKAEKRQKEPEAGGVEENQAKPEAAGTEEKKEEPERKKAEITEAEIERKHAEMTETKIAGGEIAGAEIAEQRPAEQAEKRRCAAGSDQRWKCVTANYPHFQPVSDDTVTDAIRIQPSDLRILWQKGWKQGNNSFLMHGFYRYRYLMLGKCSDGRYILGVPGIYEEQEQNMAKLFGFPEFKPVEGALDNQRFGYWCRYLD